MPKMKTHKSTAKRFRMTGTGKIRRTKIGKSHLRRKKTTRTLQKLDKMQEVKGAATKKRIRALAPYLKKK